MSNEDMIAVIEKLTGTEQLSSAATEGDPVFLPNDILPSAALPTNTEDGYLLYSVPEGTDVVAPTRISSTVLFREPGGQADAFQATQSGQLRQIVAAVPEQGAISITRSITNVGELTIVESSPNEFFLKDAQDRVVGIFANFQAKTADGTSVPLTLDISSQSLTIKGDNLQSEKSPVFASWTYAPAATVKEFVIK